MQYSVYNPLTGTNTKCGTLDEVREHTLNILKQYIDEHNLVVNIIDVKGNGDESWISTIPAPVQLNNIQLIGQDPKLTKEQKIAWVLEERVARLVASDWTQMPDVIAMHDDTWVANWRTYRQALRDLPDTMDIDNLVYPVPPL